MFLGEPPASEARDAAYDEDLEEEGYVANHTRLWSWRPDLRRAFQKLRTDLMETSSLTDRDWAVLVAATAAELEDSYCSLAWGSKLAGLTSDETAAEVIAGGAATDLTERESLLAAWARRLVRDPNATTEDDVASFREAGLGDAEIFEATVFVGFRLAFSTINDALGARPDAELVAEAPAAVRDAVTYGRPPAA